MVVRKMAYVYFIRKSEFPVQLNNIVLRSISNFLLSKVKRMIMMIKWSFTT